MGTYAIYQYANSKNSLLEIIQQDESDSSKVIERHIPEKEKAFLKDDGEIIVKRIEHRIAGRKLASWIVTVPMAYIAIGGNKTRKSKARVTCGY